MGEDGGYFFTGLAAALAYALVGLALSAVGLLVYRVRSLETAGDVVAVKWVRPVFKYGVALCTAVTIGIFLQPAVPLPPAGGMWPLLGLLLLGGWWATLPPRCSCARPSGCSAGAGRGPWPCAWCSPPPPLAMHYDLIGFNRAPSRYDVVSLYLEAPTPTPATAPPTSAPT